MLSCHALSDAAGLLQVVTRDLDDSFDLMATLGALLGVKNLQSSIAIDGIKKPQGASEPQWQGRRG